VDRKKKKQSYAKRRCKMLGAFLHILTPWISPLLSALLIRADKPSAHKMNRYGERGSPYLRPLPGTIVIGSTNLPLKLIE
jgi:hypothetical protein